MLRRAFALFSSPHHFASSLASVQHLVRKPSSSQRARRRRPTLLMEEQQQQQHQPVTDALTTPSQQPEDVFVLDDDDASLKATIAAADRRDSILDPEEFRRLTGIADPHSELARDVSGNVCHVPRDSVQFVADEFRRLRELEIERRKKILAELATPNPADYLFDGKLVPMPPLNFGLLAKESHQLAEQMLLRPNFRCVRQSTSSDYFFEINDLYCEIAFVGKANAGKSSLISAVLGQENLAKTSSVPGSTRTVNFYQSVTEKQLVDYKRRTNPNKLVKLPGGGLQFTLVDVPGFGLDGMSDGWREDAVKLTDSYLGQRRSLNTLFMCIDAVAGVTPTDERYFEWISNLHGVFWIVLTKCDAVPHSRLCMLMNHLYERVTSLNRAAASSAPDDPVSSIIGSKQDARKSKRKRKEQYSKIYPMILPVSATTGANIDFLRALVVETSGVMPANALRHLLQKRNGDKWSEAVAEEKMRLEEAERGRMEELEQVRQDLAVKRGLLLPANSSSTSTSRQQQQQQLEKEREEEDDDQLAIDDDGVMSFEIPRMVRVSQENEFPHADDDMQQQRKGFKMSAAGGMRRAVDIKMTPTSTAVATQEQQQEPGRFARELHEKLAEKDRRNDASSKNPQQQQKQELLPRRGRGILVEQADGTLVESNYAHQQQKKKDEEQRRLQFHLSKMSRRERAAYMKHSGGTRVTGDALVDHTQRQMDVGAATTMQRKDLTMRQAANMDVSKNSRLQTSSLPAGLWRQYGSANDGRPNAPASAGGGGVGASSSVIGW